MFFKTSAAGLVSRWSFFPGDLRFRLVEIQEESDCQPKGKKKD